MPAYRLQTLLEIRERAEEEAKQAFSSATKEWVSAQKKQADMEADLSLRKQQRKAKVDAYMKELLAKGMAGVTGLSSMNRYELRLKEEEAQLALQIEAQKDVVKAAEKEVEIKRQEMAHAAMEKKAIEKHKEKWVKQVKAERQAKEELNQEEIGNALHLARQRK